MSSTPRCPDVLRWRQWLEGKISPPEATWFAEHHHQCGRCSQTLRDLRSAGLPPGETPNDDHSIGNHDQPLQPIPVPEPSAGPADGAFPVEDARVAPPMERSPSAGVPAKFAFLLAPQQPDEIGRLAHYRVLRVLGEGGMGVVFEAEDVDLQRRVALKVMHPPLADDREYRQRFLREARAMAAIKHDHIVTIYQVGQDRDVPFLAMEFLQGESLEARLCRAPQLPVAEILRIGREATLGLAAAHERSLIHRDIKPDNLWLEGTAHRVRVLDFGLARVAKDKLRLTDVGIVMGTPEYMAPEQARGGDVDARSDLFSLGCVLYRMCSGRLPFQGETTMAVLTALAVETPRCVGELRADLPADLADLVGRLLAKKPEDRPASAQAVLDALRAIEAGTPAALPSAGGPPSSVEVLCRVLVRSRLLSRDDVPTLRHDWNAATRDGPNTSAGFAQWLVMHQYLTEYQVDLLLGGQADGFFFNEYRILDRRSEGSMAGVYKAMHRLGQLVAIKVLRADKATDPETYRRFRRESRLAMRLQHPNIVRTFHTGQAGDTHYLVMEYLEGETLQEVLQRRRRLPPAEAVRLFHQALRGLQHIHEQGMIHRDLNPSNLMLVPRPDPEHADTTLSATLKVLDIGLGRSLFETSEGLGSVNKITTEESMLGTPAYMAPEQARDARTADIRSDLYSLGCVFYHCLTGQQPFPDKHPARQALRHATEAPKPLHDFVADLPEALQPFLDKLLAKDARQRFATPAEGTGVLEAHMERARISAVAPRKDVEQSAYLQWLETATGDATPAPEQSSAPAPGNARWLWLGATAVVLVLLGIGGWVLWRGW